MGYAWSGALFVGVALLAIALFTGGKELKLSWYGKEAEARFTESYQDWIHRLYRGKQEERDMREMRYRGKRGGRAEWQS